MAEIQIAAAGLNFPESPVWAEAENRLYFVEWFADRIQFLQDGRLELFLRTEAGGGPSGLCQDVHGNFWVCLYSSRKVVCYSKTGELLHEIDTFEGRPFRGPCDISADHSGGVYFTDSGDFEEDWRSGKPAGTIYSISPTLGLIQVERDLCFPNGIALSLRDEFLYVNEHRRNRTLVYRRDEHGRLSEQRVLRIHDSSCLLPEESSFELGPDGMCVDLMGELWIAHYGGGKVIHLRPDGELLGEIKLPNGRMPSSAAYCPKPAALFVTEAELGLLYRIAL